MESTADLVTQDETKLFKQMSVKERLFYIKEVVTIEPLIAAYIISAILVKPAVLILQYDKSCRANLALNDTVCDNIVNGDGAQFSNQGTEVQILITKVQSWQTPVQSIMPLILVLFLGSYSDRHRLRKPFLLLPLIGELFSVAGCILSVIFMKQLSLEVFAVFQTVIPSLFGGQTMLVMAVFAYIADVSTLEMRTLRVGIVQIVMNACVPIFQSFSAVLFEAIGYTSVLLIAGFLYGFGIIYGAFWIKEPKRPVIETNKKHFLADMFDPKHAIETFKLLLKKDKENNRLFVVLLLIGMFVYSMVNVGEETIFFLYTKKFLNWNVVEYTSFLTANTLIHLVGAAVSFITGVTAISLRSLATKVVSENDLGKAQSLFGIMEVIGPAISGPVYNIGIYTKTYEFLPSAFFYFSAILYALYLVVIVWMYVRHKQKMSLKSNETNEIKNNEVAYEKPVPMEEIQVTHM
ncbi:lysosomal proton-coupled steroid conjugate and bile acid symporter SLC46A3-like isoform X2 [Euwallacea fornicatus]|uniref:lysosomal proton-coupled steroid conjugate and bile acid symporter SLC46A3-like isoform X2 n=1 Tax=Euwallacea fornicatus TaxID=995702 RepID=UPI00338FB7CB